MEKPFLEQIFGAIRHNFGKYFAHKYSLNRRIDCVGPLEQLNFIARLSFPWKSVTNKSKHSSKKNRQQKKKIEKSSQKSDALIFRIFFFS